MSVSKKRAAPKPPGPNLTGGLDRENKIITDNGKEPAEEELASELVPLKVVFPDQTYVEIEIAPSTPLIDIRTQICAKYKYSAGSHKLEPVDINGRAISFTSSSTVASTAASAVHLKSKAKEPVKIIPPKVVEQTVRLTIKMSRSNVQILRVQPGVPLSKLMPRILEKTGAKQEDYKHMELRHPDQTRMALDTSRTLDDYNIREIFVADKRVHTESSEPETTSLSLPEKTPKTSWGGSEKRSKTIKRFFRLSKKHKSSASSDDAVSPTASSPSPVQKEIVDGSANTNGNNSAERERTTKKKRPAPHKQPEPAVKNEPLQGKVPEKIDDEGPEPAEKEPVKTEIVETVKDHAKTVPASPPARPTAPPRAKPRSTVTATKTHTTGKKKAPQPPAANACPPSTTPESSSPSSKQKPSRPEKPPRRQSVEQIKEQSESKTEEGWTEVDGADEKSEIASEEAPSPAPEKPNEAEICIPKTSENQLQRDEEEAAEEDSDTRPGAENVLEEPPLHLEKAEDFSNHDLEKPGEKDEESLKEDEDEPSTSPEPIRPEHVLREEWVILTEDEIAEAKTARESEGEEEFPVSAPTEVADGSGDAPEQDEPTISNGSPQQLPEIGEAAIPQPQATEGTIEVTVPTVEEINSAEPEAVDEPQEIATALPPVVKDVHQDIGYSTGELAAEEDSQKVENLNFEENLPPPPDEMYEHPDLQDSKYEHLDLQHLDSPRGGPVHQEDTIKEDDSADDLYLPPPPPLDVESIAPPHVETKQDIPEKPDQNSDDETVQEIERLKEQINLMKRKNEKKEAEEELSRKQPYTIIPEAKPPAEPGQGQSSGVKTYTFVPNQRQRKVYEDYKAAPEIGINLSQRGEIRGVGIVPTRVADSPSVETTPPLEQPAPPTPQEQEIPAQKVVPESAPVVEAEKPRSPMAQTEPVDIQPKPSQPAKVQPKLTPKAPGGYVSSAMMKRPVTSSMPKTYTTASHDTSGRKSTLPNYYRRFLGMEAISAMETAEKPKVKQIPAETTGMPSMKKSPANPVPNGTIVTSTKTFPEPSILEKPKSPPATGKAPSSLPLVQTVNNPVQTLPAPPEESHTTKSFDLNLDDVPLPPPPEEFLNLVEEKGAPNSLPLNMPPLNEQPAPPQGPATSPNRATSPVYSPMSSNLVGISSAKPFGAKAGASRPKFRPMSAAFKSGKTGGPNSP